MRTYPQETDWLRDHLLFSETLRTGGGPSPERKERARESLRSALAHSADVSYLPARPRFAFTIAQLAIIIVSFLALTAGAAAAGGVNLRSVPRQVVDAISEPLPLSAQPIHAYRAGPANENAENGVIDAAASDRHAAQDEARGDGAEQISSSGPVAQDASTLTEEPVTDSPADQAPAAPASRSTPAHPEHDPTPTPHPSPADPLGQNPGQSGQSSSDGHNGSDGPSKPANNTHQSASNGDQPNGATGNISSGPQGSSHDHNSGGSSQGHGGSASKGGSK